MCPATSRAVNTDLTTAGDIDFDFIARNNKVDVLHPLANILKHAGMKWRLVSL